MADVVYSELPVKWRENFQQYEKTKANVLVPRELGAIPPYHTPQMAVVQINPDERAGEVYPLPGGGKYGLSKVALDRIAQAGDITWVPELSGRVDDGSDPRRVVYRKVGKVKNLSGQWRTIMGEKEISLDVYEAELRTSLPKRWERMKEKPRKSFEEWFKVTLAEDSLQMKKHMHARAESGAANRAIRSAYGIRSGYSQEELKNPFVIPKLVFTPDYSDPEVKRFMLAESTGTLRELYGSQAIPTGQMPPALPPVKDEDEEPETVGTDEPIKDAETEPPGDDRTAQGTDGKPELPGQPPPDPDAVRFEEAQGDTKKEQEALIRLIARKGYKTDKLLKPLDQFSKEQRAGFLKHLLTMKDVQPPELPWK